MAVMKGLNAAFLAGVFLTCGLEYPAWSCVENMVVDNFCTLFSKTGSGRVVIASTSAHLAATTVGAGTDAVSRAGIVPRGRHVSCAGENGLDSVRDASSMIGDDSCCGEKSFDGLAEVTAVDTMQRLEKPAGFKGFIGLVDNVSNPPERSCESSVTKGMMP
mmetsp:Transcript_87689/g.168184  ORF Transcript_87689/g.168184 Transcript_87689/m.168184 type:complete len:161 (+) Transcript_87689:309-791(+)